MERKGDLDMSFNEKLKQAMQKSGISQAQLATLTGIGKSSISQYISGKNVPTVERMGVIAEALGISISELVEQETGVAKLSVDSENSDAIPKLDVQIAAKLLGMNHNTVRKGLQQGRFPWGYAVHTSENRWSYFINAAKFAEIEKVSI
jgi:transcriptional regulator with XRE-family HTH domain